MSRTRWIAVAAVLVVALAAVGFLLTRAGDAGTTEKALEAGLAAHVAGDPARAQAKYREVLEDDAGNKFAHYNLGLIDQQADRPVAAEAEYRKALQTDPDYVPALFNLAILLTERAPDEALATYRQVIGIQPDYASAHLNLGFLLKQGGQTAEGDAEIARAIELDPALGQTNPPQGASDATTPSP